MSTSTRTIKWIENLADQELRIRSGEKASIDILTTKEEVLSIETSTFVRDLFYHLEYLTRLFNFKVTEGALQIKLSRSEGPDSVQLSRNAMRLTIASPQPGVVQFGCDKLIPSETGKGTKASVMSSGLVEARFGTFHDVEWYFLGSRVAAEQVARHYLTEFIQMSRQTNEVPLS